MIILGMHFGHDGAVSIIKDGKVLGQLGIGKAFGELAILYNCRRTASIRGKAIPYISFLNLLF